MTDCWAIIPARGGSKGVPGKNLRRLAGRSLLARCIDTARAAEAVGRVFVSTDDDAIAAEAVSAGAEVIRRPAALSGDGASSESALLHVLDVLAAAGPLPATVAFLQCTAPLTRPEDVDGCIARLDGNGDGEEDGDSDGADSALAVAPFHGFVWRAARGTGEVAAGDERGYEDCAYGVNHDRRVRERRQDRAPEYVETGAVYAFRTEGFRAARHRFFGRTALYVMPAGRHLDIDAPEDLARAEALLRAEAAPMTPVALPFLPAGLVMDFDGVFTDNRVLVREDGVEAVVCSRGDGLGLERLRRALEIPCLILSKERNRVVAARGAKLGLEVVQGCDDKATALAAWCAAKGLSPAQVAYVGNDVNDLPCMAAVGFPVAVADAHPEALAAAHLVLRKNGGQGALRELCDLILAAAPA